MITNYNERLDEIRQLISDEVKIRIYHENRNIKANALEHHVDMIWRILKPSILDWHNKQVEEVLDRLSNTLTGSNDFRVEPSVKLSLSVGQIVSIRSAIEAERNKAKGE